MKRLISTILVALSLALPLQAAAQDLSEDRVLETVRENPEIIMEAVAILEARQAEVQAASQAEVLARERDTLERDPNAPVLGNPVGDVTVVEFFDYNCPNCRRAMPAISSSDIWQSKTQGDRIHHWAGRHPIRHMTSSCNQSRSRRT